MTGAFELVEVVTGPFTLLSTDSTRMIVLVELLDLRHAEPRMREHLIELRIADGAFTRAVQPDDKGHAGYVDAETFAFLDTLDLSNHAAVKAAIARVTP